MNVCSGCGQTIPVIIKNKKKAAKKREKVKTQLINQIHFRLAIKYKTTSGEWFKRLKVVSAVTKGSAIESLSEALTSRMKIARESTSMFQEYTNWVDFRVEVYK